MMMPQFNGVLDPAWKKLAREAGDQLGKLDSPFSAQGVAWIREEVRKGAQLQDRGLTHTKRAFCGFIEIAAWRVMGMSCEAAFLEIFGRTRRTLYRWKNELGYVDRERGAVIARGRQAATKTGGSDIVSRGETPGDAWWAGDQMALPYSEEVSTWAASLDAWVNRVEQDDSIETLEARRRLARQVYERIAGETIDGAPLDEDSDGYDEDFDDETYDDDDEEAVDEASVTRALRIKIFGEDPFDALRTPWPGEVDDD